MLESNIQIDQELLDKTTRREREIMSDIAAGLTSREIATKRQISIRTVEVHRHNVLKKTGFTRATEAVAALVRGGVI